MLGQATGPEVQFLAPALGIMSPTLPPSQGLKWEACEKCVSTIPNPIQRVATIVIVVVKASLAVVEMWPLHRVDCAQKT